MTKKISFPLSTPKPYCVPPCNGAFNYSIGMKGNHADKTRIMFVQNRADSRILQMDLFNHSHEAALLKSKTGITLVEMLRF